MKEILTQKKLKELLDYNKKTGIFTWLSGQRKGLEAGYPNYEGYIRITILGKEYMAHRICFLYVNGYFPENEVDHIDRDRSNNIFTNLREVSRTCNIRNSSIRKDNKSGVVGVSYDKSKSKWSARIQVNKKQIWLGDYSNKIDAAKKRWDAEIKYGFPNCNTTSTSFKFLKGYGII